MAASTQISDATFTPLKRNRYRCNQTDRIVGRSGLEAERARYFVQVHGRREKPKTKPERPEFTLKIGRWQHRVTCPNCHVLHHFNNSHDFGCDCGAKLHLMRKDF